MPRPLKFPGLQPKFESALQSILAKDALGGADIQVQVKSRQVEFGLTVEELEDLLKNFANYIGRAKEAGLIRSGGPWAGYQLVRAQSAAAAGSPASPSSVDRQTRRPLEAATHLVATFALSLQYGARVLSLPTFVDTITWGNADMLMLRGNPSRKRLEDTQLNPDILRLSDSSPECILTSIELKYGLERNRKLWFQAVAEAAANSRWANESLLIHVSSDTQTGPIDEEVLSLARSAEIGVLEVSTAKEEARRSLEVRILSPAPQRPFLRLTELSGTRVGLLREAHGLLNSWNEEIVTFLDEDGAPAKLLRLLRQGLENLRRQAGFAPNQSLKEALSCLKSEVRMRELYTAALDSAASQTDTAADFPAATSLLSSVMDGLKKKDYDAFAADLADLRSYVGGE